MIAEHFQILCDYNYWAHHQVWDCVLALTDEQFVSSENSYGISIHEQVVHTVGAEWLWTARLRGSSPMEKLTVDSLPTRDAIRIQWDTVESDLRAYVKDIRSSQLSEIITYQTTFGESQRNARWEILAHIFNHGTDHRAKLIAMIKQAGCEAIDQDLLLYFRDNKQHRRRIAMENFHKQSHM
jgi:uncharacterized damage-inducible protein DinB